MKKYVILTSLLALSACGGGSGGGGASVPLTPVTPTPSTTPVAVSLQGFSGGQQVNTENVELTNMSSYTVDYATDESTSKAAIEAYVASHLTGGSTDLLNRSATRRSPSMRAAAATRDAFAEADAAITQMKQVVYDIVNMGTDETNINAYVTAHKDAMVNALLLLGRSGANSSMTNSELLDELDAARQAIGTAYGSEISSTNIMDVLDWFDETNFGISKQKMDTVRLKDTGGEGFFKFGLDDSGKIQSVALMEDPISEYGSSWANKRIIINNDGEAEAVAPDATWGLNPFETDYLTDKAGTLIRNGTDFSNTVKQYEFNLGKYNEGDDALSITCNMLQPDDLKKIEIVSETVLTPDEAKAKLIEYVIAKVNKKMHNQHGADDSTDLAAAVTVVNWYINKINSTITSVGAVNSAFQGDINQVATMHGMGTTDGVKLKYSDFGYSTMTRTMGDESETQYLTYVGGYDGRRMDNTPANNSLEDNALFTGTGIVTVEDHHVDKTGDDEVENRKTALYKDTGATLRYNIVGDNAKHMLIMNNLVKEGGEAADGTQWYNVIVEGTENDPTMKITFDSTDKTIDPNFQFFKADSVGNITRNGNIVNAADRIVNTSGDAYNSINMNDGTISTVESHHSLNGSVNAEYYGQDATNPTEATAGFHMDERWHNDANTLQHELAVYGAFGGQKTE